jgi:hypothetical protein
MSAGGKEFGKGSLHLIVSSPVQYLVVRKTKQEIVNSYETLPACQHVSYLRVADRIDDDVLDVRIRRR